MTPVGPPGDDWRCVFLDGPSPHNVWVRWRDNAVEDTNYNGHGDFYEPIANAPLELVRRFGRNAWNVARSAEAAEWYCAGVLRACIVGRCTGTASATVTTHHDPSAPPFRVWTVAVQCGGEGEPAATAYGVTELGVLETIARFLGATR